MDLEETSAWRLVESAVDAIPVPLAGHAKPAPHLAS